MGFARIKPVSEDAYLAAEALSVVKHEFVDNQTHAMAGASERHNIVAGNLFAACHGSERGACGPFIGDMRLRLDGGATYYYPDVMLVCDPQDNDSMFKTSPCMIAEVMSPSTMLLDRREKLSAYQKLPMLREILLIAQDYILVEHFSPLEHAGLGSERAGPGRHAGTGLHCADYVSCRFVSRHRFFDASRRVIYWQ